MGSTWRLWVPPDLGYGDEGSPPEIEPGELLVFEMELIEIEAPK
jgi:FKBP-type peptidyl-prolyl cis-trans isomerase